MGKHKSKSYRQVMCVYALHGMDQVVLELEEGLFSKRTLSRAVETLQAEEHPCKDLEEWCRGLGFWGGRGKKAPRKGQRRKYITQEVASKGPFIRVPVSILGLVKGLPASISFDEDRIILERP